MPKEILYTEVETLVRFSETDAMGVVWHGNYLKFFEDGRDAFGRAYDLDALDIYHRYGLFTPIVKVNIDYKRSLRYGDTALVRTTYVETEAAKIIFRYEIYNKKDKELVTSGETIQVFVDKEGMLNLTVPEFHLKWKEKWLR